MNPDSGTWQRALQAIKWNYLGVVLRVLIQLVAQVVLARLVGPTEFGLYSLCFLAVGIGYLIAEFGLSSALIQSSGDIEESVRAVWALLLATSIVGAVVLYILAGPISRTFGNGAAGQLLRVSAIALVVQVLSSVPLALLRKRLDFKAIQSSQIVGILVGQVLIGIGLAWFLRSAWAMLIGWIAQLLVSWILMYMKVRHSLRISLGQGGRRLYRFGGVALSANIANWCIENIDNLFVMRMFGAKELGLYTASYNLARYPTNHLANTLQSVLFPASAAIQGDFKSLSSAFLASISFVSLVTVPVFFCLAILSRPTISILYGNEWHAASAILVPLSLAMPLHALTAVSGPILWGIGRVGTEASLQWFALFVFFVGFVIGNPSSAVEVAWVVCCVYVVRAACLVLATKNALGIPLRELIGALGGSIVLGVFCGGIAAATVAIAKSYISDIIVVSLVGAIALLTWLIAVIGLPRVFISDALRLVLVQSFPKLTRRL